MSWTQTRYQHIAKKHSYLLRCCLVGLSYAYRPKNNFKYVYMVIHSLLGTFTPFPLHFLENVKEAEFQIFVGAWGTKFELGTEVNGFANKKFCQKTSNPSLRWVFTKRWLENHGDYFTQNEESGFRNCLYIWFSEGNHCLKWPCSISKDSWAFQLNFNTMRWQ